MERSISITNPNGALFVPDVVYNVFPNTKNGDGKNQRLVYRKSSTNEELKPKMERKVILRRQQEECNEDTKVEISSSNKVPSPLGFDAKAQCAIIKGSTSKTPDYDRDDGLSTFHDRVRKLSNKGRNERAEKRNEDELLEKEKKISEYIMKEVEETFKLLDVKGDKVLDKQEIKSVYQAMGLRISDEEVDIIIKDMGEEEKESLSYDDFVAGMYKEMERGVTDSDLIFLFRLLDSDEDGFVQPSDIVVMFQKCGELVSDNETREIIEKLDLNNDGLVDLEEFKTFYRTIDEYGKLTHDFWPHRSTVASSSNTDSSS